MPFDGNWTEQRANVEKLARALIDHCLNKPVTGDG